MPASAREGLSRAGRRGMMGAVEAMDVSEAIPGERLEMKRRRVLLLCIQSLLGESLLATLQQDTSVELLGPLQPDESALARLGEEMPDVVLLAEESRMPERAAWLTSQILERWPRLPVMRVGLEKNIVRLYTSSDLPARGSDLIGAIHSLPAASTPIPRQAPTQGRTA
jgi:hypothetical protein